ncbi:MAG: hypothetical protein GF411_07810 [Candidatus Lokiarchaeota archaeon]|nr:hypothetical protein [Candidatus Lokiarchaeota archaeon]
MELARSIKCKELMKLDVVDADGKEVGHVGDFTFAFKDKLELRQFVLEGSAWEEFLESIKVKPDRDPVFDASTIKKIDKKLYLSTNTDELKTTCENDWIPEDEYRLSELEKMDIIDRAGIKVGRIIDVHFDVDGSASLIVGGGFFEEALEAIGLKEDVDFVVPGDVLTCLGDKVQLAVTKDELGTTMEKALKEKAPDIERVKSNKAVTRDIGKVRLFTHRPI